MTTPNLVFTCVVFMSLAFLSAEAQHNTGFHARGIAPLVKSLGEVGRKIDKQQTSPIHNEDEDNDVPAGRPDDPRSRFVTSFPSKGAITQAPEKFLHNQGINTNFLVTDFKEGPGYYSPDCSGDVSVHAQMMVAVNGKMKIYNLRDNEYTRQAFITLNIDSFFCNTTLGIMRITDPHIRYDRFSGRWFIVALDNSHLSDNYIALAVSNDSSALTTNSTFSIYYIPAATNDPLAKNNWFHSPSLGVDNVAVYIGGNMLDKSLHNNLGSVLLVMRKEDLFKSDPSFTIWQHGTTAGFSGSDGLMGIVSPQAVQNDCSKATAGYFIGTGFTFGQLIMKKIENPGSKKPELSADIILNVPSTSVPIDQPAYGTRGKLNAFDDRLFGAMVMENKVSGVISLWTAQNIEVSSSGIGRMGGGRNAARWYEISVSAIPGLKQAGTLFDPSLHNPQGFLMPTIAMNGQGHTLLGASTMSANRCIQAMAACRYSGDALGTLSTFDTLTNSNSVYNPTNSIQRWGDYSQTIVDPSDNMTIWTFQQYTESDNSWGVRAIEIKAPPPAQNVLASGTPASFCGPRVLINLKGTNKGNAGFFDAGDGYKRLSVICSGGIAVSDVHFISPTHISCTVNTSGINAGTYTLTISNPDAQSVTANFTLLSPCHSLPVDPLYFTGLESDRKAKLTWEVNSTNIREFEVEESKDGILFKTIGRVEALRLNKFQFSDDDATNGENRYRLKIIDREGNSSYSEVILINISIPSFYSNLFPNPTNRIVNVELLSSHNQAGIIELFDFMGSLVLSKRINIATGTNHYVLNVEKLPKGFYFLQIKDKSSVVLTKNRLKKD